MNVKEAIKCGKDERRHSIFCSLATSRLTQSQKVEYPKFNFSRFIDQTQSLTDTVIVGWNTFTYSDNYIVFFDQVYIQSQCELQTKQIY